MYHSHFTAALFRQDGAHGPGAHCDDVSFAADDGRSQRRLKLPPTQRHFCLSTSWFRFREKLRRKRLSCRVAISISVQSLHDSWCLNFTHWLISYTLQQIYLCYDRCARVSVPLGGTLMPPRADSWTPAAVHEPRSHQTHGACQKMCTPRSCRGHLEHLDQGERKMMRGWAICKRTVER